MKPMSTQTDFYKTLQVHHDAGQDIIDAAYRCLSKMYHPDINKNPMSVERMKDINVAYSVIGDARKRREYHAEWLRNYGKTSAQTSPFSRTRGASSDFSRSSEKNQEKTRENALNLDIEAARKTLDEFFHETLNEQWEKAYEKLTLADTSHIPFDDFLEWKKAVSQVYKLGNYKITYFRKYTNCDYAGVIYPAVFQFSVGLTEMQIVTGQITEEYAQKYVAYDAEGWRVCLGYTDLKPSISKFKYLAQALPKLDKEEIFIKAVSKIDPLTGIFSREGFLDQVEREMLRSRRYGNPLSMAVIEIKPLQGQEEAFSESLLNACISYVSEVICRSIRKTDIPGRCTASSFAVLFTETKREDAEYALNKLLDQAEDKDYLSYRVLSNLLDLKEGSIDDILEEALNGAVEQERKAEEPPEYRNIKLGNYKLSDIMGFNKKGKNHF